MLGVVWDASWMLAVYDEAHGMNPGGFTVVEDACSGCEMNCGFFSGIRLHFGLSPDNFSIARWLGWFTDDSKGSE
jgi:hypothetical protein